MLLFKQCRRSPAPLPGRSRRSRSATIAAGGLAALCATAFDATLPALSQSSDAKPADAKSPGVVVVFDGSGSMWGRIDGERGPKFQVAREALRQSLPPVVAGAETGLLSFGHRRKGDCGDVERLVEPSAGEVDRLMQPIDRLNPKGKGPLALALREAAKVLAGRQRASIVVVHDGADNCQQDMCAAAAEIAKAQPGLAIHTVGLQMEEEDVRKSACISALTGGQAFDARDASQAMTMIADALRLTIRPAPSAIAPPKPVPAQRPEPQREPAAVSQRLEPAVAASAALGADGPAVSAPIHWRVYPAAKTAEGSTFPLLDVMAPSLAAPLPPGSYVVHARLGLAETHQAVNVPSDGPATVRLALGAGAATLSARAFRGGELLDGVVFTVRSATGGGDADASGPVVAMIRDNGSEQVLPSGRYHIRAEAGHARQERTVTVAAGERTTVDLVLGAGRLEVTAALVEGGSPLDRVTFLVQEDDPESPEGRREVMRSAAPRLDLVLPAGTYYVTARAGGSEARQRIAVGAGDVVKRSIALGLSRLVLRTESKLDTRGRDAPALATRVLRLSAEPVEAARSVSAAPEFLLPPGRYRVEARLGMQNVAAEREVEIKYGTTAEMSLALPAGVVTLRNLDSAATLYEQFWEVKDQSGRTVWRTTQPGAAMVLAPGRYTARVEFRETSHEAQFSVTAGERATVSVGRN